MFGLSADDFKQLMQIILTHSDTLKKVILFGSRARGDYRSHSDIDLAVLYKPPQNPSPENTTTLSGDLVISTLPYKVDLIDLANEQETPLRTFIEKEGVVLYDDQTNIGDTFMSMAALNEKLSDFQAALSRLHEALTVDINENSLFLDAIIQRFEFTYELGWKLMKAYLRYSGIDANNPRDVFREGLKQTLIADGQASRWFEMIDKRNLTTHTYQKKTALDVYAAVKNDYIQLFDAFEKVITVKIKHL